MMNLLLLYYPKEILQNKDVHYSKPSLTWILNTQLENIQEINNIKLTFPQVFLFAPPWRESNAVSCWNEKKERWDMKNSK
jgi:hypothetical protein